MRNIKKFERKSLKLHQDFQYSFSHARSFNRHFEIFNSYVKDFTQLALQVKPKIKPIHRLEYTRRVEFFINDCQNELKIYLTFGTDCYQKCKSAQESIKLFRKRIGNLATKMKVPDFYGTRLVVPSNTAKIKTVTIRHAFNSDRVQEIDGVLVPYYSIIFDSNLSDVLEYWINIRISNILSIKNQA
jgi:hypothetical protein